MKFMLYFVLIFAVMSFASLAYDYTYDIDTKIETVSLDDTIGALDSVIISPMDSIIAMGTLVDNNIRSGPLIQKETIDNSYLLTLYNQNEITLLSKNIASRLLEKQDVFQRRCNEGKLINSYSIIVKSTDNFRRIEQVLLL